MEARQTGCDQLEVGRIYGPNYVYITSGLVLTQQCNLCSVLQLVSLHHAPLFLMFNVILFNRAVGTDARTPFRGSLTGAIDSPVVCGG